MNGVNKSLAGWAQLKLTLKKCSHWVGEKAHWFKPLVTTLESPALIPGTHMMVHNCM